MHPRAQGDLGEASAIQWLTTVGAIVSKPLFHSPDYDLVAEMGGRLVRVEVKTTCSRTPFNHWQARLCTRGGNQSWSGTTKHFDPRRCDFVFVHAGDGRRWFIPTVAIEATSAIVLGGPKYSEFEVERGAALPVETAPKAPSTIALP